MRLLYTPGGVVGAMLVLVTGLGACTTQDLPKERSFVGKWHSSKATAPIRMDENGEWELLTREGEVVQYGIWQYFDNKLMWSISIDGMVRHDMNTVLSASSKEFKLRERDGSVTTFSKLD